MDKYGIPFDHIEEHWTDRQFYTLIEAMITRGKKNKPAKQGKPGTSSMSLLSFTKQITGKR